MLFNGASWKHHPAFTHSWSTYISNFMCYDLKGQCVGLTNLILYLCFHHLNLGIVGCYDLKMWPWYLHRVPHVAPMCFYSGPEWTNQTLAPDDFLLFVLQSATSPIDATKSYTLVIYSHESASLVPKWLDDFSIWLSQGNSGQYFVNNYFTIKQENKLDESTALLAALSVCTVRLSICNQAHCVIFNVKTVLV